MANNKLTKYRNNNATLQVVKFANKCFAEMTGKNRAMSLACDQFGKNRSQGAPYVCPSMVENIVETVYEINRELGADVYQELFAQMKMNYAMDIQRIEAWMREADSNLEKSNYLKMKMHYLNNLGRLLPKQIDVNVQESSVEQKFKEIFDVEVENYND